MRANALYPRQVLDFRSHPHAAGRHGAAAAAFTGLFTFSCPSRSALLDFHSDHSLIRRWRAVWFTWKEASRTAAVIPDPTHGVAWQLAMQRHAHTLITCGLLRAFKGLWSGYLPGHGDSRAPSQHVPAFPGSRTPWVGLGASRVPLGSGWTGLESAGLTLGAPFPGSLLSTKYSWDGKVF